MSNTLHERVTSLLPILKEAVIEKETLLVTYFDTDKNKNISIKLGRLLTKRTSLTEKEVKDLVELQRRTLKGELLMSLTQNADEIVDFYKIHVAPEGGTSSCMKGEDCVRVYDHDHSLFLATFYDGDLVDEEFYVGRTLVRTDKMQYIRTYATQQQYHDSILLTLENAGYSKGSLVGITLDKEETRGGFVMPYLDNHGMCVEDEGDYFRVVDYSTSLCANSTDGVMRHGYTCVCCGNSVRQDDTYYTQDGDVCESCYEEHYVTFEDETYHIDSCVQVYGGEYDRQYIPTHLLEDYDYYEPEDCSEYYHVNGLTRFNGYFYLTENCVYLEEETEEGEAYAPEEECTKLTFEDVQAIQDWEEYWSLGWYVTDRYNAIIDEIKAMQTAQETNQVDLFNELEEAA